MYKIKKGAKVVCIIFAIITLNFLSFTNSVIASNIDEANVYAVGDCGSLLKYKGTVVKTTYIEYENDGKNNPEFLYLAGYTYFRLQHTYTAQLTLNNAVAIKRNMPECYQLLSYIYHKTSLYDNMKSSFHKLYIFITHIFPTNFLNNTVFNPNYSVTHFFNLFN